jgi:hypothetical protein
MPSPGPGVIPPPPPPPISADVLDRHTFKVSPIERTGPGQYKIGDILVNATDKSVSFPAVINMDKGLLEYLLVRTAGKTHESLLRTKIEPYNLQVACLLVGLVGTDKPLGFQGAPETPQGDQVEIALRHGKTYEVVQPEKWLTQTIDGIKHDVPPLRWVFTGSIVRNGRLAAQVGGSIISIYHDPVAMFDNASPGGQSNKIWFVKEGAVPPVGTPVTVTIKAKK